MTGLVAAFVLAQWGVFAYSGTSPRVMSGVYAGTFAGLISLVVEMAVIGRSMRLFHHNGMQATLQTFILRLMIVGGVGIWFMRPESGTDVNAFCLTYCATFFVYLCWLTWRTYNAPVLYRGGAVRVSSATGARATSVAARGRETAGSTR